METLFPKSVFIFQECIPAPIHHQPPAPYDFVWWGFVWWNKVWKNENGKRKKGRINSKKIKRDEHIFVFRKPGLGK